MMDETDSGVGGRFPMVTLIKDANTLTVLQGVWCGREAKKTGRGLQGQHRHNQGRTSQ